MPSAPRSPISSSKRTARRSADYPAPKLPGLNGGVISQANPKTDLEWAVYYAKRMPGPADGDPPSLPSPSGGKFNDANPKGYIEWATYRAARIPGPTDYGAPSFPPLMSAAASSAASSVCRQV